MSPVKRADVAFTLAAVGLGMTLYWIEAGVRAIVAEKADEAWEKVTAPEPAQAASE